MAINGGNSKASFYSVEPGATGVFDVQYNPKNFKFDKPVQWIEKKEQGKEADSEYSHNQRATMSAELTFDTTQDGADVREVWVNRLLEFTDPIIEASTGEAGELSKKRPPKVHFTWGEFSLLGVFETINVTYTMFSANGTPLRAQVAIKMKEWVAQDYTAKGSSKGYTDAPILLARLQPGETISAVAARHGTTVQRICDTNGIDDAMDVAAGTPLLIDKGDAEDAAQDYASDFLNDTFLT